MRNSHICEGSEQGSTVDIKGLKILKCAKIAVRRK
jgi:hypothetical protein